MKTKWMLAGWCLVCCLTTHAVVTVENTVAAQTPGTRSVTIGYGVSSDFSATVTITLKAYDGDSEIPLTSISGDVGSGVTTGTDKRIVWDAGADWYGGHSDSIRFLVLADDGQTATPVPVAGTVVVPAGDHSGADPDFGAFSLSVSNSLFMDETETSKETWDLVYSWAITNGYVFDNVGSGVSNDHPVTLVNWYDCVKWCNARSELEGLDPCYTVGGLTHKSGNVVPDLDTAASGYRLPTSEEWQYAARSGSAARFPWGDQITHGNANYWSSAGYSYDLSATRGFHPDYGPGWPRTAPVGSFVPNGYGLYEIAGNVSEWCWDEDTVNGGRYQLSSSWFDGAEAARCGQSFSQFPAQSDIYSGFRAVRLAQGSYAGSAFALVDARDYTLAVVSVGGTASPGAGFHVYSWGTEVTCSVDPVVIKEGTVYVSRGWTGTGAVPASGPTNSTGLVPLSQPDSTIVWQWLADNDQDDLPNDWELEFYGAETGAVASADSDNDGYTAEQEFLLGTDPTDGNSNLSLDINSTTNGTALVSCDTKEGRTYTIEYTDSLTPAEWQLLSSFVGTGLTVDIEDTGFASNRYYRVEVHSSIGVSRFDWRIREDADGDQMPNEWEQDFFASATIADPSVDSDLDGYSNLDEYWMGSDPTNEVSHLNFEVSGSGSGSALISSATAPGRVYIIEYADTLIGSEWRLLGGYAGTGSRAQYEDPATSPSRYYRMRVVIPDGALY